MGGMDLKLAPVLVRCLLGPPGLTAGSSWTHSYSINSAYRRYNPPSAAYTLPPPTPPHLLLPIHPL